MAARGRHKTLTFASAAAVIARIRRKGDRSPTLAFETSRTTMKPWPSILSTVLFALLLIGCAQTSDPPVPRSGPATAGDNEDAPIYRLRYTGRAGQSPDQLRQYALEAAADFANSQGHGYFAVIEEGTETVVGSGPISSVGTTVPIVRSQRRGGRSRSGGGSMSIELGRPTAPAYFIRMTPFSEAPPENAIEIFAVSAFL